MMESSKETIEIDGKEYTLFLNRKGIIAWEKYSKDEKTKTSELAKKYQTFLDDNVEEQINKDTNPFKDLDVIDNIDEDTKFMTKIYKKLYWIMLYTNHQLNIDDAALIYDKACEEYGEMQIVLLAKQMLEDTNNDIYTKSENKQLKNLAALRPSKN